MYDVCMPSTLVARAPKGREISRGKRNSLPHLSEEQLQDYEEARIAAARALAQGFNTKQVAKALGKRVVPASPHTDPAKIINAAYHKIRRWCRNDSEFRDLIWHEAVVTLDLKTPLILGGVAKSAMRGRVDAARLALEVTGRHTSHEAPITQVQVVLNNIARPEAE